MSGTISNCNVTVVAGPTDAQVDVVQGLQELMMKQLEVLHAAHGNLTAPTHVTGIKLEDSDNASVVGSHIEGADLGIHVTNTERSLIDSVSIVGSYK